MAGDLALVPAPAVSDELLRAIDQRSRLLRGDMALPAPSAELRDQAATALPDLLAATRTVSAAVFTDWLETYARMVKVGGSTTDRNAVKHAMQAAAIAASDLPAACFTSDTLKAAVRADKWFLSGAGLYDVLLPFAVRASNRYFHAKAIATPPPAALPEPPPATDEEKAMVRRAFDDYCAEMAERRLEPQDPRKAALVGDFRLDMEMNRKHREFQTALAKHVEGLPISPDQRALLAEFGVEPDGAPT